jgi:hypothetical protein
MDYRIAAETFERALALAASGKAIPKEWVTRTQGLERSSSKTFIAMLGTALLARATDPSVDPLTLKASAKSSSGMVAYSARGLATSVLVPKAVAHGVHLGVTGREPLNNHPFYAASRITRELPVKAGEAASLHYLVETLDRVATLDVDEALAALASFIQVRTQKARPVRAALPLVGGAITFPKLVTAARGYITADPEGGKRGQALVAAALDLVFEGVEAGAVHDPSRRSPGDVRVRSGRKLSLAAEARQKPVTSTDVLLFAQRLSESGAGQGLYVALSPQQDPLDLDGLREQALDEYGIALEILIGVEELLRSALVWSGRAMEDVLRRFPDGMLARLRDLEISPEGQRTWSMTIMEAVERRDEPATQRGGSRTPRPSAS